MMNDDWLINYLGPAIHFVTLTPNPARPVMDLYCPCGADPFIPEKATQWCMKLLENY